MTQEEIMRLALEEAQAALAHDDVPVGAIVVKNGKVLGRGRNRREALGNPVGHAEIEALVDAAKNIGHWNLDGSTLFVTLEPCAMCAGAIVQARVENLIYAAEDPKGGAVSLGINILNNPKLNHRVRISRGPLADESSALLKDFFKRKRREKGTSGRKE